MIPWEIAPTKLMAPNGQENSRCLSPDDDVSGEEIHEKNQYAHVCSRRNHSDELFACYGAGQGDFYDVIRLLRGGRETACGNVHSETAAGRSEYLRTSEWRRHALGNG